MAQNVYSLNIVGYVNMPVEANKFYLVENPLTKANSGGNNITNLIPTLPAPFDGTLLYTFASGNLKVAATYVDGLGWAGDDPLDPAKNLPVLAPGQGFYLAPTAAGTITWVGEVVLASTNVLAGGTPAAPAYSMVGSAYPAAMSLKDLKLSDVAKDGDIVFRYSTADNKLNPFTFVEGYGWDPGVADGPTLNVGEGFYYYNAGAAVEWKQSFTVGP